MTAEAVAEHLAQPGFSTHEARTGVGLSGTGTATASDAATRST